MTKIYLTVLLSFTMLFLQAQIAKINWLTIEQASEKAKQNPKKIIIDMYTDWCSWCTKMDQTTFSDPIIAAYINKNYYPVKFDAELKTEVMFNGQKFINANPERKRNAHQLAVSLMQGQMSYPSYVFLDDKLNVITVVPGYYEAPQFEPILHFIAQEAHKSTDFETFSKKFKSSFPK